MGAHIFTRIHNTIKNDYIDLHDRHWDGDLNRVKEELKSQTSYWESFGNQIHEDLLRTEYDFHQMKKWVENFNNFIALQKAFPCIENAAAMFSMKSFNNHNVIPHYNQQSKQLLEFWGYNNPELNAIQNGQKFTFSSKNIKDKIEQKKVDLKEFHIVRVQTQDENNRNIFIDIKVRLFDKKEFLYQVLSLPEFWRNFHFISRKRRNEGANLHPAYDLNKSLSYFYTPSKNFCTTSYVGKNKKEIFELIKSESPLHLYINSFAMHLFFSMPGLALPLTAREQLWSSNIQPSLTITLNENEVNLITINYSNIQEENRQLLQEFSEEFSEREQEFARFFDLGQYSGGQYLLTTSDEFAFVYETNMIEIFDSITKFDEHNTKN
ncbi:hypothetical protein GW796_08545 [archaeon]|nr:hypothetical protein [archaeon]